jgi:hypothetical protein
MKKRILFTTLWALLSLSAVEMAMAQETVSKVVLEDAEGVTDNSKNGWQPFLKTNANFALGQSKSVPGNTDGTSFQFGYMINGALDYLSPSGSHEWANLLKWELGYSRTPVVDAFIKSLDIIDFKTSYLYHIPAVPWLGPFTSFRLTTPMLASYEVRSDPTNVIRLDVGEKQYVDSAGNPTDGDGGPVILPTDPRVEQYKSADRIDLTKAFAPLVLRESAGMFAIPVDKEGFKLDIRLGIGAWETFVRNGYVLEDNEATKDFLELRKLEDTVQVGAEAGIIAGGVLKEIFNYRLSALFMQPFAHSGSSTLKGIDLLNMEFEATAGINLFRYLSINYSFKAYKQPLIVDDWQIQNSLLIGVGFDFFPAEPAEEAAPCNCPACPESEAGHPDKTAKNPDEDSDSTQLQKQSDDTTSANSAASAAEEDSKTVNSEENSASKDQTAGSEEQNGGDSDNSEPAGAESAEPGAAPADKSQKTEPGTAPEGTLLN